MGGADNGHFAAIKVKGFPPPDSSNVDALLPLDFASRASLSHSPMLTTAVEEPELEKIGDDIVNSISIHKLPAEEGQEEDVVAVLTNNDKTVRIYSLTQKQEVTVLDFPFPMNHATISPNGRLLVAVGDMHSGFFFERTTAKKRKATKQTEERVGATPPDWTLLHEVSLYVPPGSCIEGYFTTTWSPSGRLCAVGSECGYITVFDIEHLTRCENAEDAITQRISSTRPDTTYGAGAVRTMQFSPAPWDLLIWSEDQANVCVADVRTGLKVRQVLTLDPKEEGTERVEIADFDLELSPLSALHDLRREADFVRTYRHTLNSDGTGAAANLANHWIDSAERRRLHRRLGVVESDDDPHGLTPHERQVLDALPTSRQREYATGAYRQVTTCAFVLPMLTPRRTGATSAARPTADTFTEFVSDGTRQLSESTRRLNQIHERLAPRRQASVIVVSEEDGNTGDASRPPPNITGGATTRSPNPMTAHIRRNSEMIAATDDAWRTIEEALARNARAPDNSRTPDLRNDLRRLRQLTQMRERLRLAREADYVGSTYARRNMHDPAQGLRTAGLAMSQDGRRLYCGTEEGIFEFRMNLHQRKGFPAITPR